MTFFHTLTINNKYKLYLYKTIFINTPNYNHNKAFKEENIKYICFNVEKKASYT